MSDNHKRRSVTSVEEDIISDMPELLIVSVLERLPIEDAVRTSVLSKKWRYKWTTIREFNFRGQFLQKLSNREAFHHIGFIRIINKIMIGHQGPILKFHLEIPNIVLDSFQEIDQWMLILSRNNVKKLRLYNLNRTYPLPSCVFSCLELTTFGLYNCIFNPPPEFKGFPNLGIIAFKNIIFGNNLSRSIINLPQLKFLYLHTCVNVNNLNIKAVKLRTLRVMSCPDAMLLRLLHSKHLHVVHICLLNPIEDLHMAVERFNLMMMLSKMPNIKSFIMDGYFLKFLGAQKFPLWLPHAVKLLKEMEFQTFNFGDLDQVQKALCILQNSPNLEVLRVTNVHMGPMADLELTYDCLKAFDSLYQTPFMLQTIEITPVEGSRPELLFIKLLLNRSPHLESMIIRPRATADAKKIITIAKDVLMFPRASNKAILVYLDPQP
ncbi:hypothetical protein SSX86_023156 [Deinandra increscens subsp. villosa]|uniref:F-box domain-containing protein n=1 Tax=Deinandra increscens subsp. villosa TaxID=3103831 RepID=A0AAP0CKD0_9ASTR